MDMIKILHKELQKTFFKSNHLADLGVDQDLNGQIMCSHSWSHLVIHLESIFNSCFWQDPMEEVPKDSTPMH